MYFITNHFPHPPIQVLLPRPLHRHLVRPSLPLSHQGRDRLGSPPQHHRRPRPLAIGCRLAQRYHRWPAWDVRRQERALWIRPRQWSCVEKSRWLVHKHAFATDDGRLHHTLTASPHTRPTLRQHRLKVTLPERSLKSSGKHRPPALPFLQNLAVYYQRHQHCASSYRR